MKVLLDLEEEIKRTNQVWEEEENKKKEKLSVNIFLLIYKLKYLNQRKKVNICQNI